MTKVIYGGHAYDYAGRVDQAVHVIEKLIDNDPEQGHSWFVAQEGGTDVHLLIAQGIPIAIKG